MSLLYPNCPSVARCSRPRGLRISSSYHPQSVLSHAGIAALQQPEDGRWHQVLDHPETFLETSATAMFMWSYITGVMGGFLDRETYDPGSCRRSRL